MIDSREYYRRHLPHWQPNNATFFVTFRLKNSLPREVVESLKSEREKEKLNLELLPQEQRAKRDDLDERRYFGKWDAFLDRAELDPHWLSQPEIAEILKEALLYRDGREYNLYAFCIMSNHAHVVFEPLERRSEWYSDPSEISDYHSDPQNKPLNKIMQSLKRHTARQSNKFLSREGPFWQDESYDRVIRDNEEFLRIVHYILQNPVKAGLVTKWEDWPWTYCKEGLA